jgi:hypothetical protein
MVSFSIAIEFKKNDKYAYKCIFWKYYQVRTFVLICNCQLLVTGRWFSPGPPVSSTNKTDRHDISEILLKVALNTIKQTENIVY